MMEPEYPTTADDRSSRRHLLRGAGVLAGGAVVAATGVAAASSAQAAPGEPVRLGRVNSGGAATTTIRSSGAATLGVEHRGGGDGVVASTGDSMGAAVRAVNTNDEQLMGVGGAVVATGEGCAAVVARTHGGHDAAIYAYGYTDDTETEFGNALYAIGTVYLSGPVYIEGDLIVSGTLYCDDVRPLSDRQRAELHAQTARRPSAG